MPVPAIGGPDLYRHEQSNASLATPCIERPCPKHSGVDLEGRFQIYWRCRRYIKVPSPAPMRISSAVRLKRMMFVR